MSERRSARIALLASAAILVLSLSACSSDQGSTPGSTSADDFTLFVSGVDEMADAVRAWADSETIEDAHVQAERALNLVVGPNGPGYGDLNDDGTVSGASDAGVLPGLDGTPEGLATPLASNACIERDVLGGDWSDPEQRWETMTNAIDAWAPGNNTMPSLPSHPMRVVGWATFTLESDDLDLAHEYASHAALHVAVTEDALDC